jgi:hypothetical protein
MSDIGTQDISSIRFALEKEDMHFIMGFHWQTSNHLKEAVHILLRANLSREGCGGNNQPRILCDDEFRGIKLTIASNPNTPPSVLTYLARDVDPQVAQRVAENPRTPEFCLHFLGWHPDAEVRLAVAENASTWSETLEGLTIDANPDVRFRIAENPNTPDTVLEQLKLDANPYVSHRASETLVSAPGEAAQVLSIDFVASGHHHRRASKAAGRA